jgi:hypothetical protein
MNLEDFWAYSKRRIQECWVYYVCYIIVIKWYTVVILWSLFNIGLLRLQSDLLFIFILLVLLNAGSSVFECLEIEWKLYILISYNIDIYRYSPHWLLMIIIYGLCYVINIYLMRHFNILVFAWILTFFGEAVVRLGIPIGHS